MPDRVAHFRRTLSGLKFCNGCSYLEYPKHEAACFSASQLLVNCSARLRNTYMQLCSGPSTRQRLPITPDPDTHDTHAAHTHTRHTHAAMQRAIDTAKADYAHLIGGESGVKVWGYAECNRVSSVHVGVRGQCSNGQGCCTTSGACPQTHCSVSIL